MHLRFATPADREAVTARVAGAAVDGSVRLTPDESTIVPVEFRREDGTSMFRPRHSERYTSRELWEAEDRLLDHGRRTYGPAVDAVHLDPAGRRHGSPLGDDQRAAVRAIATSGRSLEVLVGPAGTGKTTTMRALRTVWESEHGRGSVVGIAASASAAEVLADELDIPTENTAKWTFEHRRGSWNLKPGQMVIIDEASLAGTFTLGTLAAHASEVGAKVLLVGDPHQLDAVDASGAFSLLVADRRERGNIPVPELAEVRRFAHDWEKDASLRLRGGDLEVIDAYAARDRIRDGDTDTMIDAAYTAWSADVSAGRSSLMVAEGHDTVTALNVRARSDRIAAGDVDAAQTVRLQDGTDASSGDVIVTRRNNRHLHAGRH